MWDNLSLCLTVCVLVCMGAPMWAQEGVPADGAGGRTLAEVAGVPDAWAEGTPAQRYLYELAQLAADPETWVVGARVPVGDACNGEPVQATVGWSYGSVEQVAGVLMAFSDACGCGDGAACAVLESALGMPVGTMPAAFEAVCRMRGTDSAACVLQALAAAGAAGIWADAQAMTEPIEVVRWCEELGHFEVCGTLLEILNAGMQRVHGGEFMLLACEAGALNSCAGLIRTRDWEPERAVQALWRGCEAGQPAACATIAFAQMLRTPDELPTTQYAANATGFHSLDELRVMTCGMGADLLCRAFTSQQTGVVGRGAPVGDIEPWPDTVGTFCDNGDSEMCFLLSSMRMVHCLHYGRCDGIVDDDVTQYGSEVPAIRLGRALNRVTGAGRDLDIESGREELIAACEAEDPRGCSAAARVIAVTGPGDVESRRVTRVMSVACDNTVPIACEWLYARTDNPEFRAAIAQQGCTNGDPGMCARQARATVTNQRELASLDRRLLGGCEDGDDLACGAVAVSFLDGDATVELADVTGPLVAACNEGGTTSCWSLAELMGYGFVGPTDADGTLLGPAVMQACSDGSAAVCEALLRLVLLHGSWLELGIDLDAAATALAQQGLNGAPSLQLEADLRAGGREPWKSFRALMNACHAIDETQDSFACYTLALHHETLMTHGDTMLFTPPEASFYARRACLSEAYLCPEPWW
jgi:hypothetical protein